MKTKYLLALLCFSPLSVAAQMVEKCDKGTVQKPVLLESSAGLAKIQTRCWKENDKHFATSELWVGGKKVYATPSAALQAFCGSAAGEIYTPHNWSPDGNTFVFVFSSYCWQTEPMPPVVMFHRVSGSKTFPPRLQTIPDTLFKKYPESAKWKKDIDFILKPLHWKSANQLQLSVEILCYGCQNGFPTTLWTTTPEGKVEFVSEEKESG